LAEAVTYRAFTRQSHNPQTRERASHRLEHVSMFRCWGADPNPVKNRFSGICRVRLRFPGDL